MNLLAFGTYDLSAHPRFETILQGLQAHGDRVVEVNVPLGLDTASRVALLRQPWRLPQLALRLLSRWVVLGVRGRVAWRKERPDAVLVGYLGHFDVLLARLVFGRRAVIVLDHLIFAADTARDRGQSSGWKIALLQRLDQAAVRAATIVLVDTPEHAAMVRPGWEDRCIVVPVGAPAAWYDAGQARRDADPESPLRVVFYGLFTPLQGAPCIGRALGLLDDVPGVTARMIGRGQDLAEARLAAATNARIVWEDWVPATDLPALVSQYDICLGIFGTSAKAMRVVPNKVYQGAAAGCAIVTSDSPAQRAAFGDAACYVPAGDATALAGLLRKLAADRSAVTRLGMAARARAQELYRPEAVVRTLRESLVTLCNPAV